MSLELITPPAEEPVSLAEIKEHLRVTHGDEDAAIDAYARAARRAVEARGGLALVAQGWRFTRDRAPEGHIALPRAPVLSVDGVTVVDRDGAAEAVDPDLYEFEIGPVGRFIARGLWPYADHTLGAVRIDFTAGWALAADVPEELKLAVKMLTAHFYENREGASEMRLFAAPQAVDALIGHYRQVRL